VLTIRLGTSDLASIRFSVSPLIELWQSVRALQSPVASALHSPWLVEARSRVADLDFAALSALQPARGRGPDFVHPPPDGPLAELELELERMVATPSDQMRREVSRCYRETGVPDALRGFLETPDTAVADLADLLRAYWERVLAPYWERIRTALEGDVLCRAQQAASKGIQALLGDIDHSVRYEASRLIIEESWSGSLELRGRGLLLVPSVFVWPAVSLIKAGPWQPTLIYPARGSGLVWEPYGPPPDALAALIGARRASILATLETPCSTTALAHRLDVCPGSVSGHLAVLHEAGLIERHRVGRVVLYRRSAAGNLLVDSPYASTGSHRHTLGKRLRVAVIRRSREVGAP
jgi:DNA-binding transcriptional ArsR family regulator